MYGIIIVNFVYAKFAFSTSWNWIKLVYVYYMYLYQLLQISKSSWYDINRFLDNWCWSKISLKKLILQKSILLSWSIFKWFWSFFNTSFAFKLIFFVFFFLNFKVIYLAKIVYFNSSPLLSHEDEWEGSGLSVQYLFLPLTIMFLTFPSFPRPFKKIDWLNHLKINHKTNFFGLIQIKHRPVGKKMASLEHL